MRHTYLAMDSMCSGNRPSRTARRGPHVARDPDASVFCADLASWIKPTGKPQVFQTKGQTKGDKWIFNMATTNLAAGTTYTGSPCRAILLPLHYPDIRL